MTSDLQITTICPVSRQGCACPRVADDCNATASRIRRQRDADRRDTAQPASIADVRRLIREELTLLGLIKESGR